LETAKKAWQQMVLSGPLTLEGHHRRKDGSRFPHEARLSTYHAGDRQFILGLVRDTTERTQFEMKLRENEATIRTLLDTASQAIVAVNPNGAIVLANRMVGQMFGYLPDELQGKQLEVLIPERLRERHRAYRIQFDANPSPRLMGTGMELLGLRSDGVEFPIEVSLSSVSTKQGLLAVSFVSDITARKHAEEALRESEQQLRLLAGSLLTAQEDERRSLARELHDDITQQLAFLSIELGKLGGQISESTARARLHAIQEQALRASSEIRRLSHGLHPSVITDFGLSVALEEFCEDFERVHGVSVEFEELAGDSKPTDSQATCLYRVAQEGMRNAITHGSASEIRVSLELVDETLRLTVADNGTGFEADQVKGKAGLGITSMKERVRLSGGRLSIVSSRGQGTEIAASLPLRGVTDESYENHPG
jgi:PAS domain S-box-containing protein